MDRTSNILEMILNIGASHRPLNEIERALPPLKFDISFDRPVGLSLTRGITKDADDHLSNRS